MHNLLLELTIFTAASVIFVPLFKYFNLGPILAYLFAGIVIGPHLLGLISDPETILHFSELGVVFLLFIIGLELAPARLWRLRNHIFGLGALQVVLTGLTIMYVARLFGFSLSEGYVIGFALSLSSTAFAIQILKDSRQLQTTHGQGSFSILMFQDLAVVPLMASLKLFSDVSAGAGFSWLAIVKGGATLILLITIGPIVVRWGMRFIADTRLHEIFIATALLIVIGSGLLMEYIGLSLGMGAFIAGVLLAESDYRHELETNLEPFKGLLLGLFFIAVGMSLNLNVVLEKPHIILMLTIGLITIKSSFIYILARVFKFPHESSRNMSVTLPQGGEFGFVIFSLALTMGILKSETVSMLNVSIILSMALTPLLFSINQKVLRSFNEISERPYDKVEPEDAEVIVAGYGRFGQIVSRFLDSQGVKFTILEHSAAQVDAARKFGRKIYYGDASRLEILKSAGTESAKYFLLAIDDVEKSVETAKVVRDNFPNIKIIARARNRQHVMDLMKLGVEEIHRETLLTSLEVAKVIMLFRGAKRESINKKLAKFVKRDQEILSKQFELRESEKELMNFTIQANKELETILRLDEEETI